MRTLQKMIGKAAEGYTRPESGDPKFRFVLTIGNPCKLAQ